jgi:hypothetical protein
MNETSFEQLDSVDDMSQIIEEVFGVKLDITGGWGYDNKRAVIVNTLDVPIDQFLHMFASIRVNIEMNLTREEDERFGGINLTFVEGEQFEIENQIFDKITYQVTAMKESEYADFIQEYKDNYGKNPDFDMSDHFKRREESKITLESDFWFSGLEPYYHVEETSDNEENLS